MASLQHIHVSCKLKITWGFYTKPGSVHLRAYLLYQETICGLEPTFMVSRELTNKFLLILVQVGSRDEKSRPPLSSDTHLDGLNVRHDAIGVQKPPCKISLDGSKEFGA